MTTEFTLKSNDQSQPYQWILEGVSMEDVTDAREYVENYARSIINATNYSEELTDGEIYAEWLESGEVEAATDYVQSRINEWQIEQAMTPAEIEDEFGLAEGTVRQAVNRETIAHRRPDERTILIHRKDAEARWIEKRQMRPQKLYKFQNAVVFEQLLEGVTRKDDPLSHDLMTIQHPEGAAVLDWRAERQSLPSGSSPVAVIVDGKFVPLWEGQYFTLEEVEQAVQVQPV